MASPKNTVSFDMDRRSSLRTRVPKQSDIKESPNSAQRSLRSLPKQPMATIGTVGPSPIDTTVNTSVTADTVGTYRSIEPKLDPELIPSELLKNRAMPSATLAFNPFVMRKKTILRNKAPRLSKVIPRSVLERQALSRSSSPIADYTNKSAKAHDKNSTTTSATPFIPLPLKKSYKSNSENEDKKSAKKSRMAPKPSQGLSKYSSERINEKFEGPSKYRNKRNREKFEEPEE